MEARNQYTLGYNTAQKPSSNFRDIEVRVKRPGLQVYAKHGYYPLPPQRAEAAMLGATAETIRRNRRHLRRRREIKR